MTRAIGGILLALGLAASARFHASLPLLPDPRSAEVLVNASIGVLCFAALRHDASGLRGALEVLE